MHTAEMNSSRPKSRQKPMLRELLLQQLHKVINLFIHRVERIVEISANGGRLVEDARLCALERILVSLIPHRSVTRTAYSQTLSKFERRFGT